MLRTRHYLWSLALLLMMTWLATSTTQAEPSSSAIRLYALDCGRLVFKDMSMFSDTDEYDGQPGAMADPCFLIQHPLGTLLWDTGLGDKLADQPEGMDYNGVRLYVDKSLQAQLRMLNLKPEDIKYLAFSHFHLDHTGNANLFTHSTWIINQTELAAALSHTPPIGVDASAISVYNQVPTKMIDGDYDVFGDGTVRILKAPGHTPGHQVLLLKLHRAGAILLSGDLYHTHANRKFKRVPRVNTQRADTLASMERIERIIANTHARLVVQHDADDFHALPSFPGYLE